MLKIEIDKIRKQILKHGFKPRNGVSSRYDKNIYIDQKLNSKIKYTKIINISIMFSVAKEGYPGSLWAANILVELGETQYVFKESDYYPGLVDDILIKVNQYLAFCEFIEA